MSLFLSRIHIVGFELLGRRTDVRLVVEVGEEDREHRGLEGHDPVQSLGQRAIIDQQEDSVRKDYCELHLRVKSVRGHLFNKRAKIRALQN